MQLKRNERTLKLVQIAMLVAIELILGFTPLGFLRVGTLVEISFMTIPIAIAATTVGPLASTILGAVFGLASFGQCFGMSAFGIICLSISPWKTAIVCIVPRVLMGLLTGYIFQWMKKTGKSLLSFTVTSLSAAVLNTLFFVLFFFLLFRTAKLDFGENGIADISVMNLAQVFVFLAGINGIVEAVVCTILSTAIGKALSHYIGRVFGTRPDPVAVTAEAVVAPTDANPETAPAEVTSGPAGTDTPSVPEEEPLHSVLCPHWNGQFEYRGKAGKCPFCGLDYPNASDK